MTARPRGPHVAALPLEQRVWGDVRVTDAGCWEWPWLKGRGGYGSITVDGRTTRAHRVAYELANGPIPEGMYVLHSCDNRPCVNPAHLRVGPAAKLNEDQVRAIRSSDEPARGLASRLGVSEGLIRSIRKRRIWRHLA